MPQVRQVARCSGYHPPRINTSDHVPHTSIFHSKSFALHFFSSMSEPYTLKEFVSHPPSATASSSKRHQDIGDLIQSYSWPPVPQKEHFVSRKTIDKDPFPYFVSPQPEDEGFPDEPNLKMDSDLTKPERKRSRSLSPPQPKSKRYTTQHSPTSSSEAKLKRWIKKMERRCHDLPSLLPQIVEIWPKDPPELVDTPSSDESDCPQTPPQSDVPRLPVPVIEISPPLEDDKIPDTIEQLPSPESPVSPSSRGRPAYRAGSTHRSRRSGRPRSWRAPSYDLESIPEEAEEVSIGLGIAGA